MKSIVQIFQLISSIIMEFLYFYFIFLFTAKVVNEQKIMGVRFTKKKKYIIFIFHHIISHYVMKDDIISHNFT